MSEKRVNQNAVANNSQKITNVSEEAIIFSNITPDSKSTITAKYKSLEAISKSQNLMGKLSGDLKNESKNIDSIGAAFKDYDEAVSALVKGI